VVEIIPKPTKGVPLWQDILLYLSIVIFIGGVGAYFGLGYFIGENQKVLKEKEQILAQPRSEEEQKLKREVLQYQQKIDDFAPLINQHRVSSDFFVYLEEIIHPQVWLSELKLDVLGAGVEISGETEKTALGQQLLIFQAAEEILETNLTKLQAGEGEKVSFTISLSLDPEIFQFLKPR
jgi:Tfp pilus assembly protein PilN